MRNGQEPSGTGWRDLLLIGLLWCIIWAILYMALEWAARQWGRDWLNQRYKRTSMAAVIAVAGAALIGSWIADALGFKPNRRPEKLDSKPPLP
ncbi:hypothetical protein [Sphingomonas humi]|uniref:Uncharacterized protein n=1 Tax=Sphingomonas humi TaxID=335630 RepID=A0ABP7RMM5_9SPHN